MPVIWFLSLLLLFNVGQSSAAAAANGSSLEDLQYRLDLGIWQEVAQLHLRLSRERQDRFRAEFTGAAQGLWSMLNRWLPESYEAEMAWEQGCLKPLKFREIFQSTGHRVRKEYRFDYARGVLEVWRGQDFEEPTKSWEVPLKGPLYDPLSLFYNLRLGALGPLTAGETLKVAILPTPEPRQMIIRIGSKTPQGHKVMVEIAGKEGGIVDGQYFLECTPQWVPQEAWTRVLVGKMSGKLVNPPEGLGEGLRGLFSSQ